tara:strand:+ start:10811 stop:11188 length:378 start_codon:yes stop_codon:yes gene_type:complete
MKISKNFSKEEFDCSCGCEMSGEVLENITKLVDELEVLREHSNSSIIVNSGYRCDKYNKRIGGAKRSQHKLGNASDIVVKGVEPSETHQLIEQLIDKKLMSEGGLGSYNNFTHYDIGYNNRKRRW